MCFYNSNSKRTLDLAKRYGRKTDIVELLKETLEEQYKITAFVHPECPIITDNQNIETAKWGLIPNWIKDDAEAKKIKKMTLNARAETVFSLPSFRSSIMSKRCLVPSTGFFEFHHFGIEKIPYYIFLKNEDIFSFGGIFDDWKIPNLNETIKTFSILTVPANEFCEKIHNGGSNPFRMPLIIARENEEKWLDNTLNINDIKHFFHPCKSSEMDAYTIARDFLKKNPKDRTIIKPAA